MPSSHFIVTAKFKTFHQNIETKQIIIHIPDSQYATLSTVKEILRRKINKEILMKSEEK